MDTTTTLAAILGDNASEPSAELVKTRRALLKVAFELRGQSPQIDRALAHLTNALRSGDRNVDFSGAVDNIVAALSAPKTNQTNPGAALDLARRTAEEFMGAVMAAAGEKHRTDLRESIQTIAASKNANALLSSMLDAGRHIGNQLEQAEKIGPDSGGHAIAALFEAFAQLHFPESLITEVQVVRKQLTAQPPPPVPTATRAISRLVQADQDESRKEVERLGNYLQKVASKVAQLQNQLQLINNSSGETLRESEALNRAVTVHVQDIQQGVDAASDIQSLKSTITGNLQSLHKGVDVFMTSTRQRSVETEELLTRLNDQLQTLEGETKKLGDGMLRERARASTDQLTGIPNRFALGSFLAALHGKGAMSKDERPSIIIADIDNFKIINDKFGHMSGDKVLKGVADILRAQLRPTDFLARYGGEEFLAVLPNTSIDQAFAIADQLRSKIEMCRFHARDEVVPVTISLGVAELSHAEGVEAAFERADKALYSAKRKGRNRAVRADDPEPVPACAAPPDHRVEETPTSSPASIRQASA